MKSKIDSPVQGDTQKGNDSYHASSFGKSVESLMKSRKNLIKPLILLPKLRNGAMPILPHTLTPQEKAKLKKNTI